MPKVSRLSEKPMISYADKVMLTGGISLDGLAVLLQATPSLPVAPTGWIQLGSLGIVGFVVWRLFMVEMPEWRQTIREMSGAIAELTKEVSTRPCMNPKDDLR